MIYKTVLLINIFVMAPMAVGMSAVARPLFEVLLGERWLPTVPYFEVIALAGVFYPLSMVAYNVLKVHSNGAIIFRLELLKKAIMTIALAKSTKIKAIIITIRTNIVIKIVTARI